MLFQIPLQTTGLSGFDRKSAWSIPLVVVFSEAFDTITAAVILIFNLIMQSLFISISAKPLNF